MLLGKVGPRKSAQFFGPACQNAAEPRPAKARFYACFQKRSTARTLTTATKSQDAVSAIENAGNNRTSTNSKAFRTQYLKPPRVTDDRAAAFPESTKLKIKRVFVPNSESHGKKSSQSWEAHPTRDEAFHSRDRSKTKMRRKATDVSLDRSDVRELREVLSKLNKEKKSDETYLDASEILTLQRIIGRHTPSTPAVVTSHLTNSEVASIRQILDRELEETQKEKALFVRNAFRKNRRIDRDYLLQKGPLSYDWRVPFGVLRQHAKLLDDDGNAPIEPDAQEDRLFRSRVIRQATIHRSVSAIDIPRPGQMTRETFARYIYELASSQVPTIHTYHVYGKEIDHRNAVRDRIMGLFSLPELIPYISRPAFHMAMSFLHENSFVSDSRQLFYLMADLRIPPSRETFHIMLRDIAAKKNVHAFAILLDIMARRNVISDGKTWQYFLKCIESGLVKMLIVDHMKSLNLLQSRTILQAVATELIAIDLEKRLETGGRVAEIIFEYNQRFGEDWFCTSSANKMFHILGQSGRLQEASDLLEFMADKKVEPDLITFKTLMQEMSRVGKGGDIHGEIEVVGMMQNHGFELDSSVYELLFRTGLRLYRPNWCRAVWQVACLRGKITQEMSVRVMKGLTFTVPPDQRTALTRWPHFLCFGAKIIPGIEEAEAPGAQSEKVKLLADLDAESSELTDAARDIRSGDFEKSLRYEYTGDFAELLRTAVELDKQWIKTEEYRRGDLEWMLANAIEVPRSKRKSAELSTEQPTGRA